MREVKKENGEKYFLMMVLTIFAFGLFGLVLSNNFVYCCVLREEMF